MNRKLPALLCAVCLLLGLLPGISSPAHGAEGETRQISSAAQLTALSAQVDAGNDYKNVTFELTCDINLGSQSFMPIGTGLNARKCFRGSFNGCGYTISGLNVNADYVCAGLFGSVEDGTIENLILDSSCKVSGSGANVGAFVGSADGVVLKNCRSAAKVYITRDGGSANIGGLVGCSVGGSRLEDCTGSGEVSVSGQTGKSVGGLVGYNEGNLERCISLGNVSASGTGCINNAGGISGFENNGSVINCYCRGSVSASGGTENNAGGVTGRFSNNYGILRNCYSTGSITASGTGSLRGGVIGKKLVGTVYYCYYKKSGSLTGIGGESDRDGYTTCLTGAQMTAKPGDAYGAWADVLVEGRSLGGTSLVNALNEGVQETPDIWAYSAKDNDKYPIFATSNWADMTGSECYFADFRWLSDEENDGSDAEHPYLIGTGAELAALAVLVNIGDGRQLTGIDSPDGEPSPTAYGTDFEDKYIRLTANIELGDRFWTPIGDDEHAFRGCFDGDSYAVYGMNIGSEKIPEHFEYSGLFGHSAGKISGVTIADDCAIHLSGEKGGLLCTGGVVGKNEGTVSGCQSYCSITLTEAGQVYAGGIAGESYGSEAAVKRCYNGGALNADLMKSGSGVSALGGIVGLSGRETDSGDQPARYDESKRRNAVLACRNAGSLNVNVWAASAKVLAGGVVGQNVLLDNSGGSASSDSDSDSCASVLECCNLGRVLMTLRASDSCGAVGGIAGGNTAAYNESDIRAFFSIKGGAVSGGYRSAAGDEPASYEEAAARVISCYNAGSVSGTIIRGTSLDKGAVIGICSTDELTDTENCFYFADSVKSGTAGIGNKSDNAGVVTALDENQMKAAENATAESGWKAIGAKNASAAAAPMLKVINSWGKQNDTELRGFTAAASGWPAQSIRIIYDAQGGEKAPTDNRAYEKGEAARVILTESPKREDSVFLGWALKKDAEKPDFKLPGSGLTLAERRVFFREAAVKNLQADTVLYAVWESKPPKSKNTATTTTKNEDGTTTVNNGTTTVAQNGDKTVEATEVTTDANGKTVSTKKISSFYDSALGTTTELVSTKADGKTVKTASFKMENPEKVTALPEDISAQLRAGTLESLAVTDEKNGTTAALGWSTDENGKKTGQSAEITGKNGSVTVPAAVLSELQNGSYEAVTLKPGEGLGLELSASALKSLGAGTPVTMEQSGNKVKVSAGGAENGGGVRASVDYKPEKKNTVVAVDGVRADGSRDRVFRKFTDGKLRFALLSGATDYEIYEIDFLFDDVSDGDWFIDAVKQMYGSGLMTGVSETSFAPGETATRAMLVTMLWRMEGRPQGARSGGFEDVSSDAWYSAAVDWAAEKGIVTGVSATAFAPDAPVTREQLVTILYRWRGFDGDVSELPELSGFSDGASASAYARDALRWAASEEYITGRSGGVLDPAGKASRCELAAILSRALDI